VSQSGNVGLGRSYQCEKTDRSGKQCRGQKKQNGIDRIPASLLRDCGNDSRKRLGDRSPEKEAHV
jgi:hypothetical protein